MLAVLSVGSTEFSQLVEQALCINTLAALQREGYSNVFAQIGRSKLPESYVLGHQTLLNSTLELNITRFDNAIDDKIRAADLVIAHAGAGTILAALNVEADESSRTPTKGRHLILAPNTTLMDNHQLELALQFKDYPGIMISSPSELERSIDQLSHLRQQGQVLPALFPSKSETPFQAYIDNCLGFKA